MTARATPADVRGVEVTISLDAPESNPDLLVAALLERADGYLHRALERTGRSLIAAYVDRLMALGIETGQSWTTWQQTSLVDDLLASLLSDLEEAARADFKRRLLIDLAATVVPRLSDPTPKETS